MPTTDGQQPKAPLLTFRSGGWVILLAALLTAALLTWAIAPAVLREFDRPPGDGETIESYAFALEPCIVDEALIVPATLYRDMVPVLEAPAHMRGADVKALNEKKRGKFLVSDDRVIGVVIDGEARAYPMSIMYVHEIVNDTLAGTPIAVTYNFLCDSTMVFDRRIEPVPPRFRVSGLVYNSNLLMYAVPESASVPSAPNVGGESLWSQLAARAVTGPDAAAGRTLTVVPSAVTHWADWLERHPETTVITKDPGYVKRYKHAAPDPYFRSADLPYPIDSPPPADGPAAKSRVVAVTAGDATRVYPLSMIFAAAGGTGAWTDELNGVQLHFTPHAVSDTVVVRTTPPDADVSYVHCFWFAWHAMRPGDQLVQ
jgi:hypothetical protein